MALLNKIYLLTDIFLFEEKDAHNNFKKHYEILSEKEMIKKIKNMMKAKIKKKMKTWKKIKCILILI